MHLPDSTRGKLIRHLRFDAQRIAFGPIMFHVAILLRDLGMLGALKQAGPAGLTAEEAAGSAGVSLYGARVLLEGGLSLELVQAAAATAAQTGSPSTMGGRRRGDPEGGEPGSPLAPASPPPTPLEPSSDGRAWSGRGGERYAITRLGALVLQDPMTRANMDFVRDVCYQGMFHLEEAIRTGKPAGLKVFGDWPTVYQALSELPPQVQESWFRFDHFYSDSAFPAALPLVFRRKPRRILDVGGNTGKFALQCARHDESVRVTLLDLPGQLAKAAETVAAAGFADRIDGHPIDLLDASQPFPGGYDVVWMSQFLVCFAEEDIVHLLRRGAAALADGGSLYILDTYWDRQSSAAATYCLHASSLYFTCMANGTSRMYHSRDMVQCVEAAGLRVEEDIDGLGISHTLLRCRPG
jgi:2-polyprenyl-3-methyl-5-hydroxy-6-metoxy-1,4-benzoquinol methylase